MTKHSRYSPARQAASLVLTLLLACIPHVAPRAQEGQLPPPPETQPAGATASFFRLEKREVVGGAELLTVFGDPANRPGETNESLPLVSILRDTLGDDRPENDRLRYVWMLTYTRPSTRQRLASAVPFLYGRVGDRRAGSTKAMPPPVIDLAAPERDVWERFLWAGLQNVLFSPYGLAPRTAAGGYRRNETHYRKAHLLRALAILTLYEAETGAKSAFTPEEAREIQARLALADQSFGGIVDDLYLDRARRQHETEWLDARGHNWELLRQRAEAEGLYFEPLLLPDGGATHALVWMAREDLARPRARRFDARFLNISDPFSDARLKAWNGYVETWHFDAESRIVSADTAGARAVEMIPLALYGLEHPKVPTILIDFRDQTNPKRREMSRRVIEDVAGGMLSLSKYGGLHFFLGRAVFDFVTARRGMDINQPSRVRAYSQLKLLLALNASLEPGLRREIEQRVDGVSLNPLENGAAVEARIARRQYESLLAYAERPDGLSARLDRARRSELVKARHNRAERFFFNVASVFSLGLYRHREELPRPELLAALDRERSLEHHFRFLREVVASGPLIEVVWNIEDVRRSLREVMGARRDKATARLAARLFAQTADEETRRLCLDCLYRMNNETARTELTRIHRQAQLAPELRALAARYLGTQPHDETQTIQATPRAATATLGQ
jgi:nucleoside diphosphate kinase